MEPKTILVTGSNGFIGSKIVEFLVQSPVYKVVGWSIGANRILDGHFSYTNINLTNYQEVEERFSEIKPDVLIHCAAISQVDVCELNPEMCQEVNVRVTAQLVHLSNKCGSRILYFSSDFVFDGSAKWVLESESPCPISKYGESKHLAELEVKKASNWAVIRPVLVYGFSKSASRGNIVTWVLDSLKMKTSINVVDDQIRTPTYVDDVVKLSAALVDSSEVGYFHIGGADEISVYDFAVKISNEVGLDSSIIQRVKSAHVEGATLRPKNSCFDNSRIKFIFGINPIGLTDGIRRSIKQII